MSEKFIPNLKNLLMIMVPAFLLVVLQYRIWFDDSGVIATRSLQHGISKLHQDNEVQQSENESLMAEVMDLRAGSSILEEKAREELGLVREGETFILFVDPQPSAQP